LIILIKKSIKSLKNNHFLEYAREWPSTAHPQMKSSVVIALPRALVPQVGVTKRAPEHANFLVTGELAEQTVHLFLWLWQT
jgi:hypothetical protein